MNVMLILFVLLIWLTPHIYFFYCLEKRRPWALDIARSVAYYPWDAHSLSVLTRPRDMRHQPDPVLVADLSHSDAQDEEDDKANRSYA